MDNKHHGSGFMNGLVIGAVLGAGAVFFLGTKKGKQIFKALTENGFENLSELKEMLDSDEFDDGEEEEMVEEKTVSSPAPKSTKRFFRGIRK